VGDSPAPQRVRQRAAESRRCLRCQERPVFCQSLPVLLGHHPSRSRRRRRRLCGWRILHGRALPERCPSAAFACQSLHCPWALQPVQRHGDHHRILIMIRRLLLLPPALAVAAFQRLSQIHSHYRYVSRRACGSGFFFLFFFGQSVRGSEFQLPPGLRSCPPSPAPPVPVGRKRRTSRTARWRGSPTSRRTLRLSQRTAAGKSGPSSPPPGVIWTLS